MDVETDTGHNIFEKMRARIWQRHRKYIKIYSSVINIFILQLKYPKESTDNI